MTRETLRDVGGNAAVADVARPASVDELADVLAAVASRRVAIRGRGQSYFGQSLSDDLIVSTERLDRVLDIGADTVTVQGGATWRALIESGARPAVSPTWLEASVGGVLASGGIGRDSATRGLAIDHVVRLLVVTGDGQRIACTHTHWLFDAVLAGGGEFGVIAEATLRLGGSTPDLRPPRPPPPAMIHLIVPAAAVERLTAFAQPHRVAVHPIARTAGAGLCFPPIADACSVSVMSDDHDALIAEAQRLGGAPTMQDRIADWRAFLGARHARFEQAKRLADPAGILARFR